MRDLSNHINVRPAIYPAAADSSNTALVSQILNLQGYDSATLAIIVGAAGTTGATYAVTLTEGNQSNLGDGAAATSYEILEGSNLSPAPDPALTGLTLASFTGANGDSCFKLGYVGNKQYIQATITPAGNSAAAYISAIWILGHPNVFPTPNPPV